MSPRTNFDKELEELNRELYEMATRIDQTIGQSIDLIKTKDTKQAEVLIRGDRTINDMEKTIETKSLSLIMRQQPIARDLRIISTALKVVTDLERIGDHAADIAEIILNLNKSEPEESWKQYHIEDIHTMAEKARKMVHDAVEAFLACDLDSCSEIIERDDEVDDMFNKVKLDIIDMLTTDGNAADYCVDVLMVAKYLERIGDHAVNICEWTQYHETGALKNVRLL